MSLTLWAVLHCFHRNVENDDRVRSFNNLHITRKYCFSFIYFAFITEPTSWYLSNFPSTKEFISSGALLTGEASPGYMVCFINSI